MIESIYSFGLGPGWRDLVDRGDLARDLGLGPDQNCGRAGALDGLRGLPHAVEAQGHWLYATAARSEPGRTIGLQIMRLGWNIFIPVTLVWLVVVGAWKQTSWNI